MLIDTKKLKALFPKFSDVSDELLKMKLEAIEMAIRQHTNNSFQNRAIREACYSLSNKLIALKGEHLFKVGDTVQISVNRKNAGLYVVEEVTEDTIMVDKDLYQALDNLVTKIVYPQDVIMGAINVLDWDCFGREKMDVASETISRHSVSYHQYDGTNTVSGYPSALFGFCANYMRART